MLKLSKTIAAKAWLVPGAADYMASCHSDSARPALPPGEHPSIPSLHHLLLGWHKLFSSCMNCILPTKKTTGRTKPVKIASASGNPGSGAPCVVPKKAQFPFLCCNSLARLQKPGPKFTYQFGKMCSHHILWQYL